jgi:hypothetical protein
MNNLYVYKKLYWIIKNTGKSGDKFISDGFMRQTSPPWLVGRGVQIRVGKYVLQIGTCGDAKELDEQNGLLHAIQGRVMETNPDEIGAWK